MNDVCTINGVDATYEHTYHNYNIVLTRRKTQPTNQPTNQPPKDPSFRFSHHPEERGFASLAPIMQSVPNSASLGIKYIIACLTLTKCLLCIQVWHVNLVYSGNMCVSLCNVCCWIVSQCIRSQPCLLQQLNPDKCKHANSNPNLSFRHAT